MSETIFSKIISGEIPSFKIYENDYVYAFLDISQVTKGHTLLVPKKVSANIFETDEETMKHIGVALPKVANAIKAAFNPDGLNIIQNNGEFADQSVFHFISRSKFVPKPQLFGQVFEQTLRPSCASSTPPGNSAWSTS